MKSDIDHNSGTDQTSREASSTVSSLDESTLDADDLLYQNAKQGMVTEQHIVNLEEGQYFGAYSLVNDLRTRPVSIYAAKSLHLMEISHETYKHLLRFHR